MNKKTCLQQRFYKMAGIVLRHKRKRLNLLISEFLLCAFLNYPPLHKATKRCAKWLRNEAKQILLKKTQMKLYFGTTFVYLSCGR